MAEEANALHLWYDKPAGSKDWNEALPIGNGVLGGMVYGGIRSEQIQLNEETVWYGRPKNRNNPDSLKYLARIGSDIAGQHAGTGRSRAENDRAAVVVRRRAHGMEPGMDHQHVGAAWQE